ncbi:MAG: NfeD family protein, partial [Clostridia bacterium]|nr:NfeD family protein [Clostridia bacterium]
MSMIWVWLIVIVVAVILESISPIQLVSIWAALGGIAALALSFCRVDIWIQVIVFFAVTILMIALTRPLARKLTKFKKTATNADMNIGKVGKVT